MTIINIILSLVCLLEGIVIFLLYNFVKKITGNFSNYMIDNMSNFYKALDGDNIKPNENVNLKEFDLKTILDEFNKMPPVPIGGDNWDAKEMEHLSNSLIEFSDKIKKETRKEMFEEMFKEKEIKISQLDPVGSIVEEIVLKDCFKQKSSNKYLLKLTEGKEYIIFGHDIEEIDGKNGI